MPDRLRLPDEDQTVGSIYGLNESGPPKEFIHTGCTLLDLALGGGWALGRIANIIGDKSTGKTQLCIEAAANFRRQFKPETPHVFYREAEAAFDTTYASRLGLRMSDVDLERIDTVEEMYKDIDMLIKKFPKGPTLYVIDSLDALSDLAEMAKDLEDSKAYAVKARKLSEFFRKKVRAIENSNMAMLVVNQIRDNMNAGPFGRKWSRTGGHAMDFYATHQVVLTNMGQVTKTINKLKQTIGVDIRARVEKNKISTPFREASYQITFNYGIEDRIASLDWFDKVGVSVPKGIEDRDLQELVREEWYRIEDKFMPAKGKYDD